MIFHDFRCDEQHTFEQRVTADTTEVPCVVCQKPARRVFLKAPKLDWLGMAMGENAGVEFVDRFERIHNSESKRQEGILAEHGDYGPGYEPPPTNADLEVVGNIYDNAPEGQTNKAQQLNEKLQSQEP